MADYGLWRVDAPCGAKMNRRGILRLMGMAPFVGALVPTDGVAFRSTAHPSGASAESLDLDNKELETIELDLVPYATEGEEVTCESGHVICEFVKTVHVGQLQDVEHQLGNYRQTKPEVGQFPLPVCEKCGASFTNGSAYHFADGWRGSGNGGLGVI